MTALAYAAGVREVGAGLPDEVAAYVRAVLVVQACALAADLLREQLLLALQLHQSDPLALDVLDVRDRIRIHLSDVEDPATDDEDAAHVRALQAWPDLTCDLQAALYPRGRFPHVP